MKRAPIAGVLLGATLCAAPARGASWYTLGGQIVRWAGNQSIRDLSPGTFPPGSETEYLILGAMGLWNIIPSTNWQYFYDTLPQELPIQIDGYNVTVAVPTEDLDPGVLGLTLLGNQGAQWVDMDMVFPEVPDNIGWDFGDSPSCETITDPETYGFSFILTAVHEMGHALGLGHSPIGNEPSGTPWFIATMNPAYPSGGSVSNANIVELWTDDRNGLRTLYPYSGPSKPPYRDLANAGFTASNYIGFAIPVIFWPTAVYPSQTFTARAAFQNFGNTAQLFVNHGFYLSLDETVTPDDMYLGSVEWDIALGDAFDYDVDIDVPDDLPAGQYNLVSRIDDDLEVTEIYEDNNEVTYCQPLTILRLAPIMLTLGQQTIPPSVPWTGPTAHVTKPLNMGPVTWSIDAGPSGLVINSTSGVLSWPSPVASPFQYAITVRATNSAGTTTGLFFLGVTIPPPTCDGDITGDGRTNTSDFSILAGNFGKTVTPFTNGDVSGDGIVDSIDFNILAGDWGCGP